MSPWNFSSLFSYPSYYSDREQEMEIAEFDSETETEPETIDDDEDDEEDVYAYSHGKNEIVLCELFHPRIHGFNEDSDPCVLGHYLVIGRYPANAIIDRENSYEYSINYVIHNFQNNIRKLLEIPRYSKHPWIRNYKKIVTQENYICPEIAECILLSGQEKIAIKKTFWLRLVQRSWKRVFQERCQIRHRRQSIYAIAWRELRGDWPNDCLWMPGLRGMLSELAPAQTRTIQV